MLTRSNNQNSTTTSATTICPFGHVGDVLGGGVWEKDSGSDPSSPSPIPPPTQTSGWQVCSASSEGKVQN